MSITTPQNDAVVEALKEASDGWEDRARTGRRRREERPRKANMHYDKRETLAGYLFISPWIIGFLVFTAGAMVYGQSFGSSPAGQDIQNELNNAVTAALLGDKTPEEALADAQAAAIRAYENATGG